METLKRKPLQGVANILRFNWHFYVIAVALLAIAFFMQRMMADTLQPSAIALVALLAASMIVSLLVSYYVYDLSGFYQFQWLKIDCPKEAMLLNVHAGFDETSSLLKANFPDTRLVVLDFFNPKKHTELSIRRARKRYGAYPGTIAVTTNNLQLPEREADFIFCILSAHEIRDNEERCQFFQQLRRTLKDDGTLIVVEHLRDLPNFLAYTVGAFHFHSAATWQQTFSSAGLYLETQQKITPFITAYYLHKNGTAS